MFRAAYFLTSTNLQDILSQKITVCLRWKIASFHALSFHFGVAGKKQADKKILISK